MNDDGIILFGLFLLWSSPFFLALILKWRFPKINHRMTCHVFSAGMLLFWAILYAGARISYWNAGNQDDGGSSMALYLLIAASVVVIPENLLLYLPSLRRDRKGRSRTSR